MSARLANVLEKRDNEAFVGRDAEFLALDWLLELPGPRVLHLSGSAGIGKSTLLNAFTARSRDRGATIIRLDCRSVEPSRPGLLTALASATGAADPTVKSIISRIRALDGSVVLVLDGYELFLLMDTFLRLEFGPRLPGSASVLVSGRNGPVGAWLADPGWQGRFRAITLGPLTERDALTFLQRQGFESESARRINAVARGHPLALTVATRLGQGPSQRRPEDAALGAIIDFVAQDYLASSNGGPLREALEAASVIRRVTESLIAAMVPDLAPGDTVDRLLGLPFVESTTDGLFIHDAVRDAIATRLAATDPERYRRYRVAAWHQLRTEIPHSTRGTLWRYTADILYLLRHPLVREGFFPSGYQPLAVEPAKHGDDGAIRAIVAAHEGAESCAAILSWWTGHPEAVRVCRDADGDTTGMLVATRGSKLGEDEITADPIAAAWSEDMRVHDRAAQSLLLRRLLDHREGEESSGSRGALGVDVKRTYMELRPTLRYVYLCGVDPRNFDWCDPLGFQEVPSLRRTLDGRTYHTLLLDMGPGSVDAWLARVVADELGIPPDEREAPLFDPAAEELVIGHEHLALTPLELGVMKTLHARAGRPVTRVDLLERVWRYESGATSNVVDAVVLNLRRKLGAHASVIETVRGVGYRFRPPTSR